MIAHFQISSVDLSYSNKHYVFLLNEDILDSKTVIKRATKVHFLSEILQDVS